MMSETDVQRKALLGLIYNINAETFNPVAIEVWKYQFAHNPLYTQYCKLLGVSPETVKQVTDIPFLPISMFRNHEVMTGKWVPQAVFRSSGTTGQTQSKHAVRDLGWYHMVTVLGFERIFGSPAGYTWIGLLPSYLERPDSSLVEMVRHFMDMGQHSSSGFFPFVTERVTDALALARSNDLAVVLMGVSFALLDLFEKMKVPVWDGLLLMETGGMKGRGREVTREELYERIRHRSPSVRMSSEYGMTELLSQAYRREDHFYPSPTMRVFMRDISDPLGQLEFRQRGGINIIDLANLDTCSFIATDDIGVGYPDGGFDVLGRLDNSELRGCNLLYASA